MLVGYGQWLVDTSQNIGLSFGGNQLPYSEIAAWCDISGVSLSIWEAETVRYLSGVYVTGLHDYEGEGAAPAYISEEYKKQLAQEFAARRLEMLGVK